MERADLVDATLDALQPSASNGKRPADQDLARGIRGRILGVLIRRRRLEAQRSLPDCAGFMDLEAGTIEAWEYGESEPSLPQLELLARFFDGGEPLSSEKSPAEARAAQDEYILLRRRLIGALLRAAREDSGASLEDLGRAAGLAADTLYSYEFGEEKIPVSVLTALAQALEIELSYFAAPGLPAPAGAGGLSRARAEIDQDWRQFASESENLPFIRLAMAFQYIARDDLGRIADALIAIIRANGEANGWSGAPREATAMTNSSDRIHRIRIFLLLFAFSLGVYMLAFRGAIQSGDTRRALDAVTSFARYGDWLMDETNWIKQPFRIRESEALPLGEYLVDERLNILLATPLLRLAETLPRLGNIHAVWLFNVITASLTVGFIYLLLRALSYSDAVAAIVAISAALGTNLWAYSQTFFRDPLTAFFILAALLALKSGAGLSLRGRAISLVLAFLLMILACATKYSALFALPAAIVFALPERRIRPSPAARKALGALLALPALLIVIIILFVPVPEAARDFLLAFGIQSDHAAAALRAYLLSPGASFWATSPLLLCAIPGAIALWRSGRAGFAASVCLLSASYALGHALLTGPHWFGGLSWPPRFLLPIIPVLMLATAPVVDSALRRRSRLLPLLWMALLGYGIWIQYVGSSLSFDRYGESLPSESNGLSEWEPSLLQPRYFRWVVLPERWRDLGLEFLWARADLPLWNLSFALFTALVAAALALNLGKPGGRWRHLAPLLALLGLPLILVNLMSAHDKDPRAQSSQGALHEALDFLAANANADDVVLLPGMDYGDFMLNHMDSAAPRPVILDRPLAQAVSDRQPAAVASRNPNDWFEAQSFRAIRHIAGRRDRLWLLAHTSPFLRWSFRPLERYLALHYYPLREAPLPTADESVRLLEYSTRSAAPNPLSPIAGDIATDLRFGDHIRLLSFTLPNGARYRGGETIELSLLWATDAPLERDYTVASFIADPIANMPVAQGRDSGPQDNFAPTSSWTPDSPVWDNRALRLPDSAPPGDYQIWLLMYRHDSGSGEIARLAVAGESVTQEATAGVLPIALVIE